VLVNSALHTKGFYNRRLFVIHRKCNNQETLLSWKAAAPGSTPWYALLLISRILASSAHTYYFRSKYCLYTIIMCTYVSTLAVADKFLFQTVPFDTARVARKYVYIYMSLAAVIKEIS
jgi:hypothetical protein